MRRSARAASLPRGGCPKRRVGTAFRIGPSPARAAIAALTLSRSGRGKRASCSRCCVLIGFATSASPKTTTPPVPITLIVPYAAGGSIDLVARILAEGLDRAAQSDRRGRGQARRQRRHRHRRCRQGETRRLHAADGRGRRQRHARRRAEGLSVRSAARLRAGRDGGGMVGDPGGEEGSAGQHARRVRRLCQGAARRAQLRHHRLRQLRPSRQRSVHAADRHRDAARAVQGRRRRRPTICSPARSTRT